MRSVAVLTFLLVAVALSASGTRDGVSLDDPPADAFRIEGSDLVFSRDRELRWGLDDGILSVQTTREHRWRAEHVTANVVRLCQEFHRDHCVTPKYLIRIGSPEYKRMLAFRQCVAGNRGRNLFDVEECELPWEES